MDQIKCKYLLVRAKTEQTSRIHQVYDVLPSHNTFGEPVNLDLWEVIEESRDGSASEWMRLLTRRDGLRIIFQVMES